MCGIAGEIIFRGSAAIDRDCIPRIADVLAHRGPDDWGYYVDPGQQALLVHTRLAIVDLLHGHQPLCNEDGRIWVSVNGEIYEHELIREELCARGHHFRSRSDSEVIVHLYEEFGEAAFERLRGEFAFALYDSRDQRLYLVRDRFGIKPLFYRATSERLQFGSEMKAIFCHADAQPELDPHTIGSMIMTIVPPGATVFRGVRALEPGCFLRVDKDGPVQRPYWRLNLQSPAIRSSAEMDEREAAGEFRRHLTEAIRLRLQGDVEVGAYLSGGIDSSAIVAVMAGLTPRRLKTFTIGFENPDYDETVHAAALAGAVGAESHVVRLGAGDLIPHFAHSLWHHELPVMNGHGAAKFLLSRLAGQHVKVVLSGEGADELLFGYPQFKHQHLIEQLRAEPHGGDARKRMKQFLATEAVQFGVVRTTDYRDEARVLRLFGAYPYPILRANASAALRQAALIAPLRKRMRAEDPVLALAEQLSPQELRGLSPLRATQYVMFKTDLPNYILNVLGDRSEMSHSVEGRVPFLDHPLVEFTAGLPLALLSQEGCSKHLLRQAVADVVPPALRSRRKKIFLSPTPELLGLHNRDSEFDRYLARGMIEEVGVFDPLVLAVVRRVFNYLPRRSYAYGICEGLVVFALSVHILHELYCKNFAASRRRFAPGARLREIGRQSEAFDPRAATPAGIPGA